MIRQIIVCVYLWTVVTLLSGCTTKTTLAPADDYPGFSHVAKSGPAAKFYVDLKSVKSDSGVNSFKFLQVLSDGYAIQDAVINAESQFTSQDGIEYSKDGSTKGKFNGINVTIDNDSQPGLTALMKFVKSQSALKNAIVGIFDDTKALEILYGPYRADLNGVARKNLSALPGVTENNLPDEGIARVFLSKEYDEGGARKHLILVSTNSDDNNCHACSPLVSGAIFQQQNDKWCLSEEFPCLDLPGQYGKPAEVTWQKIGEDSFGLVVESTDGGQGALTTLFMIMQLHPPAAETILRHCFDYSMDDELDCKLTFDKNTKLKQNLWDAFVTVTQTKPTKRKIISHYRFEGSSYVLKEGKPSSELEGTCVDEDTSAVNDNQVTSSLDAAKRMLLVHFSNMAQDSDATWKTAYEDFSENWRKKHSFLKFSSHRGEWYQKGTPEEAIVEATLIDEQHADVDVDMSHFTNLNDTFRVSLVQEPPTWKIEKMVPLSSVTTSGAVPPPPEQVESTETASPDNDEFKKRIQQWRDTSSESKAN